MRPPALAVSGANLVDPTGAIVRLPGFTAFSLFPRMVSDPNGFAVLVDPILTSVRTVATEAGYTGWIVARTVRHAAEWNAFHLKPWSYPMSAARVFTDNLLDRGFYTDWTGCDYQVTFPSADPTKGELHGPQGIHQHHNEFCAALDGTPYIWNVSNEPFKNGLAVADAPPPPWCSPVRYSGDYADDHPPSQDLACINLHTDRGTEDGAEKWVGKAHESAPFLWRKHKPIFYDEPMGADEVVVSGRRSNVPQYFGVLGSVSSMVSAVYFHSTAGLSGNGMGPEFPTVWPKTRACMVEFFRGFLGGLQVRPR